MKKVVNESIVTRTVCLSVEDWRTVLSALNASKTGCAVSIKILQDTGLCTHDIIRLNSNNLPQCSDCEKVWAEL